MQGAWSRETVVSVMSWRPLGSRTNPHGRNVECHRMPRNTMARMAQREGECGGMS